jgi:hypothetical protein
MAHRLCNVTRLFRIKVTRLPLADGAKTAMSRADVAAQHESRRAVRPALKDIRTARFLTDGVQIQPFDELQNLILIGRIAEANPKPFGFGLTDPLIVADNTKFASQLLYL